MVHLCVLIFSTAMSLTQGVKSFKSALKPVQNSLNGLVDCLDFSHTDPRGVP